MELTGVIAAPRRRLGLVAGLDGEAPGIALVVGGNDLGPRSWVEQFEPRVQDCRSSPRSLRPSSCRSYPVPRDRPARRAPGDAARRCGIPRGREGGHSERSASPAAVAVLVGMLVAVVVLGWIARRDASAAPPKPRGRDVVNGFLTRNRRSLRPGSRPLAPGRPRWPPRRRRLFGWSQHLLAGLATGLLALLVISEVLVPRWSIRSWPTELVAGSCGRARAGCGHGGSAVAPARSSAVPMSIAIGALAAFALGGAVVGTLLPQLVRRRCAARTRAGRQTLVTVRPRPASAALVLGFLAGAPRGSLVGGAAATGRWLMLAASAAGSATCSCRASCSWSTGSASCSATGWAWGMTDGRTGVARSSSTSDRHGPRRRHRAGREAAGAWWRTSRSPPPGDRPSCDGAARPAGRGGRPAARRPLRGPARLGESDRVPHRARPGRLAGRRRLARAVRERRRRAAEAAGWEVVEVVTLDDGDPR